MVPQSLKLLSQGMVPGIATIGCLKGLARHFPSGNLTRLLESQQMPPRNIIQAFDLVFQRQSDPPGITQQAGPEITQFPHTIRGRPIRIAFLPRNQDAGHEG